MLEPYVLKGTRTVLRREGGSNPVPTYPTGNNILLNNTLFSENGININYTNIPRYYETFDYGGAIYGNNIKTIQSNFTNNFNALYGGAIYYASSINITDSTFTYNKAACGGAIFGDKNSIITITNSNLTHNNVTDQGGAIYHEGNTIIINNITLENNNAVFGGAIWFFNAVMNITNSKLRCNIATDGGAINNFWGGKINITDSTLDNNQARSYGGAIKIKGNLTIHNSTLNNNQARSYGGAIVNDYGTLNITNSTINNNTAPREGAIYNWYGNISIINSQINNNNATEHIGAICGENITLTNCTINNNIAQSIGAISGVNIIITNTTINNNIAYNNTFFLDHGSGTIKSNRGTIIISDSTINNNKAAGNGGAITSDRGTIIISDSTINNNKAAGNGGAIHNNAGTLTITQSNLTHNTATLGGAIHGGCNLTITNSNLTHNTATKDGGAINNQAGKVTITSSNITHNNAKNGNGGAIHGGGNLTIRNSNLTHNTAIYGGAIHHLFFDITINNSNLTHNTAWHGGAIINYDCNLTISKSNLTHNNATGGSGAYFGGGAVSNQFGNINIIDCNLNNNTASGTTFSDSGGAINNMHGNITIANTNLTGNIVRQTGGAIHNEYSNLTIINSNLNNNTATEGDGGAIENYFGNITIQNSNLNYNNANSTGGAIYNNGTLTITNSSLTHNNAILGGAIYNNDNLTITNTNLTHNNATEGGAINNYEKLNIIGSNLNNNTALMGGAIDNFRKGNITINNSTLNNNIALGPNGWGGAIYNFFGILLINNTILSQNNARDQGGAIDNYEGNSTIINCTLNNNKASIGGAIDTFGNINIHNSTLNNNIATAEFEGGGAIRNFFYGNMTITNTTLNNNSASTRGGAIYNIGNTAITNSKLNKNNALIGGLIYNEKGNLIILESNFKDNYVKSTYGYVVDFMDADSVEIIDSIFINNTDNARDMLFSDAKESASVEIRGNTYIDNFLEDSILEPKFNIVTDNKAKSYTQDVDLKLRSIYNDTVRNGSVEIYVNGVSKGLFTVNDGKTSISFNNADLTRRENEITLKYTTIRKHYQNTTTKFSVLKEVDTVLSIEAPQSMISGDVAEINFTLKDVDGNNLSGESVHVYVDDVNVVNLTTNGEGVTVYRFVPTSDGRVIIGGTHHTNPESIYMSAEDVEAEIIVSKIQPEIRITNTTELVAHHEAELQFNLTDHEGHGIADKILNIKISEDGKADITGTATTNNNGIAVFKFTPDDDGIFWVNTTFAGDIRYHHTTEIVELNKDNVITNLEITATDTEINKTNTITIKVIPNNKALIDGSVTLNISGEIHTVPIRDGSGTYTSYKPLTAGDKNITGYFTSTTPGYGHSFAEEEFTVEKLPTHATITVLNNKAGNVTLKATIQPKENTGSTVNGGIIEIKTTTAGTEKTIYTGRLVNGELTFKTDIQETGWYDFEVIYHGNDYFTQSENNTKTQQILPINTKTTTYDKTTNVGSKITLNATLKDENGANINGGEVKFYLNKRQLIGQGTTNSNGIATTEYSLPTSMTAGTYTITAQYDGNQKYTASSNDAKLTVNTLNTQITSQTLDNTKDNTTIKVTLTSPTENNKAIPNAPLTITDKNGNPIGQAITNNNGEATIKLNLPIGSNPIKISYPGNQTYEATEKTETINVAKIPTTTTINIQNNTAGNVIVTGTVKDKYGKNVNEGTVNIKTGNNIVATATLTNGAYTTKTNIGTKGAITLVAEYTGTNTYLPSNSQTTQVNVVAQTPTLTTKPEGDKVGNTSITATLKDPQGKPITNAPITVTLPNGTKVTGTTNKDGITTIPLDLRAGTNDLTINYPGNGTYDQVSNKETMIVNKNIPTIKLNPVRGVIGENIILTAYLTGVNGENITGGNLVFKLNGKSLRSDGRFDSDAAPMKLSVKDGKVTITLKADLYLRNAKNLTAAYSGNYKYEETGSPTVEAQIQKRYAGVTLTVNPTQNKQYDTIRFTATVRDTTKNGKNTTLINQNTSVMFKVNGNTLRDKNGQIIYVPVNTNKQAIYDYTIPAGTGGITASKTVRDYKVDAVFVGINYYPGSRNNSKFNVERSPTTVTITQATVNTGNVLSVKATLKDFKGNNLIGTNKVTVKINGRSYIDPKNGKPKYWSVKNGVVDLTGITVDPKTTIKRVMVVTGERQAYLEGRAETTTIVRA